MYVAFGNRPSPIKYDYYLARIDVMTRHDIIFTGPSYSQIIGSRRVDDFLRD